MKGKEQFEAQPSKTLTSPEEVLAMFAECQCGNADVTGASMLCPLHYTLQMAPGRPSISGPTRQYSTSADTPPSFPPARSPSDLATYYFTPPMSLEDFLRAANINHAERLATELQERYQRRKAENRTAQRAYRDREKHRLSLTLQRVREMETELRSSVDMQKHWQTLYETLFAEYEKLWNEVNLMTASPLSISRASSISGATWMGNISGDTGQGGVGSGLSPS